MGTGAGSRLSSKRPEVSAVCGGAVGAAPNREGEGEAGEGKSVFVLKAYPRCLLRVLMICLSTISAAH